jgi:hypothetical protein
MPITIKLEKDGEFKDFEVIDAKDIDDARLRAVAKNAGSGWRVHGVYDNCAPVKRR